MAVVSIWSIITAVFIAFVLKTEKSDVKFRTHRNNSWITSGKRGGILSLEED